MRSFDFTIGHIRRPVASLAALLLSVVLLSVSPLDGQSSNPNKQDTPPEAGGPQGEVGPYAIPKKKEEPPPPPPERPKKIEGMPDYSLRVNVPLVNVDVSVLTKDGQFINGLKKDNFKILEDGVPQTVANFGRSEAPVTVVLLFEYASTNGPMIYQTLTGAFSFLNNLKKEDWVAVISYDMKPYIHLDFTQDKQAVRGVLNSLGFPGFSETNLYDALYDTLDRIDRIEGHKYVILLSTGIDTFSKLNLDKIYKKVKTTHDVTIYPISIGWYLRTYCEAHGCTGISHGMASYGMSNIDYLQADNQMATFAKMTGGQAFIPRFEAEFPEIFHSILGEIRNQYNLGYHPTNSKQDGSYRKIKVELVAPDGGPLKIRDQKGKDVKVQIIARDGYTARQIVE